MSSDLERAADRSRADLLARERAAASAMVRAYGAAWRRIAGELDRLAGRLQALQRQVEAEIGAFARFAEVEIVAQQRAAVAAAQAHAAELVPAAAGDGPPGVAVRFDRLPTGALEELVGALADGSPLADLLGELGPAAARSVREALVAGLATGQGPRAIARRIRADLGGSLARALTIARTETLRAYRESSRRAYRANDDVVAGWIWHAQLGPRTCAACWAMHGSRHALDERLDGHPNCRCSMIPVTKSWAELGFPGVPDARPVIEPGEEAFRRLPAADQLAVLGPAKHAAYRAGEIGLADLVARDRSERWGTTRREASLAEARARRGRAAEAADDD